MAAKTQMQRTSQQVRGFVLIWTFITLIMGLATFLAIYFAYQPAVQEEGIAIADSNQSGDVVVIASATPLPVTPSDTPIPLPTMTPASEQAVATDPLAIAQVASNTPAPSDTPQPTLVPPDQDRVFMSGVQIQIPPSLNPDEMNGWYRSAQQMNSHWVKIQVRWEIIEPERGQYDWEALDLAMAGARGFGIRPMLSIVTAPDWARESGVNIDRHGPPANFADYVGFVRTILERYDGQVYAVEIWNEQNLDREWTSIQGLSARNYVELLRQTYNMVQEVSNGTIVISGALSPTGLDDGIGAIDDFRYMQQMIDNGMLDVVDCVGAHHNGYNISPLVRYDAVPNDPSASFRGPFDNPHHSWSFRSTLEGYTQRIRNAGSDKKLCVTEFGWAVTEDLDGFPRGFEFANDNSLAEQAQFFTEALDWMSSGEDVWLAFVWNLNYGPQAGYDPLNDNVPYSLIGPGGTFRPAYDAIRDWNAGYLDSIGRR
jgi:polysaccharide biosynthesis protein PslG